MLPLRKNRGPSTTARNIWLGNGVLGGRPVYMKGPIFEGKMGSDTIGIAGTTGSGKSVTTRVVVDQVARLMDAEGVKRPVWVFDPPGRDHYLGWFPNKKPKNLPVGIKPRGLKGFYFYYPIREEDGRLKSRPMACERCGKGIDDTTKKCVQCGWRRSYEIAVRPNFGKYGYEQFESMGFQGAAPRNLLNIFGSYGPFKSMRTLMDFCEKYPTSEAQSAQKSRKGKSASLHTKAYREGDVIRSDSLNALVRDLRLNVVSKKLWVTDSRQDINVEKLLRTNSNAVFSFNDTVVAKAEIDFILRDLIRLIDRDPSLPRPFIFIEEAHLVFNDETLVYFILVCRKLGIGLCITLPTLSPFEKRETEPVASDIKKWIVGRLKGRSASLAIKIIAHPAARVIPHLRMNRYTGEREFLFFDSDEDQCYLFRSYECPQEYNRRV